MGVDLLRRTYDKTRRHIEAAEKELLLKSVKDASCVARDPSKQELADAAQAMVRDVLQEREDLANEVVDLHARLRAYENTAGDTARAQRLEELLEDCIDTLTWLASGNEMCYAHDVDVIARDFRGRLDQLTAAEDDDD